MLKHLLLSTLISLFFFLPAQAQLQLEEPELLTASEAFPVLINTADGQVHAEFSIAEGYYLYKHAFAIEASNGVELGDLQIPKGELKIDDYFGEVETYRYDVKVSAPIIAIPDGVKEFEVTLKSQGCADVGVCYPPKKHTELLIGDDLQTSTKNNSSCKS